MRMVVLTKSSKYNNYCVAGFDIDTGNWVRLVSDDESIQGALRPRHIAYNRKKEVEVLDVIEVATLGSEGNSLQPENVLIDQTHPNIVTFIKHVDIMQVKKHFGTNNPRYLFGTVGYYVPEQEIVNLGYSLLFVEVTNLMINHIRNDEDNPKTKASFNYNGSAYRYLAVTDPQYYCVDNGTEYGRALLVISIGAPYNGKHYKFVAAIYPI